MTTHLGIGTMLGSCCLASTMAPEQLIAYLKGVAAWDVMLLADLGTTIDTGNTEPGDQISDWTDQSDSGGHDGSQSTDNLQLTLVSGAICGRAALDSANDCMALAAGGGWPSGTSHSVFLVLDQHDASTANRYALDSQTGRLILALNTATSGKVGYYDGSWRDVADAVTGNQLLEWHLDDSGNQGEMFRNGASIGTDTYGSSVALGGSTALWARYDGAGNRPDGEVALYLHYAGSSPLSSAQCAAVRAMILRYYPGLY